MDKDDYKRTSLKDVVAQVKVPSRNMARLPWRLGKGVILDIAVRSLIAKTKYLKKESMSKETNVPLTTHSYLRQVEPDDAEDVEEGQNDSKSLPVLESDIRKYQEFGHRKICFLPDELRKLSNTHEPGIDILCLKPACCDPMYHYQAPYLVTYSKSNRKDNKLLFGALLNKCESKNLMILCIVTLRKHSASKLYTMIPNTEKGGFYLYVIPFKEHVRDLNDHISQYAYNESDKKPPTNSAGIEFLKKLIKKLRFGFDPECFPNPKLQAQLQTLKTLALDLEKSDPPLDLTVPHYEAMVASIVTESDEDGRVWALILKGKAEMCTVPQLKRFLKNRGMKIGGSKPELIDRVSNY
ncbi:hypothetical protein KM043_011363 [Ampulex compressa]|nr:hypothetical protein KM043_011363 [Ampulex compressa]